MKGVVRWRFYTAVKDFAEQRGYKSHREPRFWLRLSGWASEKRDGLLPAGIRRVRVNEKTTVNLQELVSVRLYSCGHLMFQFKNGETLKADFPNKRAARRALNRVKRRSSLFKEKSYAG